MYIHCPDQDEESESCTTDSLVLIIEIINLKTFLSCGIVLIVAFHLLAAFKKVRQSKKKKQSKSINFFFVQYT